MDKKLLVTIFLGALAARHLPQMFGDMRNRGRTVARVVRVSVRAHHIIMLWLAIISSATYRIIQGPVPNDLISVAGIFTFLFGCGLGLLAFVNLKEAYSEELVIYEGARLIQDGMYAVIRHPLRVGLAIELLGAILLSHEWKLFILWAFVVLAQIYRSRYEDQVLREYYGEVAIQYQKAVPAINVFAGLLRVRSKANAPVQIRPGFFCGKH